MSCWVVPSVAAELWGCTVEAVMNAINGGHVPTRQEAGWTFLDVAPNSPQIETPKAVRPATYTDVLTPAEIEALEEPMHIGPTTTSDKDHDTHAEMGDWREARQSVSTMRRAPMAKAA